MRLFLFAYKWTMDFCVEVTVSFVTVLVRSGAHVIPDLISVNSVKSALCLLDMSLACFGALSF